jgi:hypothetical protein
MIAVAFILAVLAAVAGAVAAVATHRQRTAEQWDRERRLAGYAEHMAAANGRPHPSHVVVMPVNGYDHPEPEELVASDSDDEEAAL